MAEQGRVAVLRGRPLRSVRAGAEHPGEVQDYDGGDEWDDGDDY